MNTPEATDQIETIAYSAVVDTRHVRDTYQGLRSAAVAAAVAALDAEPDSDGRHRYRDDATGDDYIVGEGDLARLGAALLDGHSLGDAYSIWCAESEAEEAESEAEEDMDEYSLADLVRDALVAEGFDVDDDEGDAFVERVEAAARVGEEALASTIAGGATLGEAAATARSLLDRLGWAL